VLRKTFLTTTAYCADKRLTHFAANGLQCVPARVNHFTAPGKFYIATRPS